MKTKIEMEIKLIVSLDELETLSAMTCQATSYSRGEFEEIFGKAADRSINECLAFQFSRLLRDYKCAANVLS